MTEFLKKKSGPKLRDIVPGWNRFEYFLLRCFCDLVNAFPLAVSISIARCLGGVLYFFTTKRQKIALYNLDIAYGNTLSPQEKQRIAKESFRHLVTSLLEFFRIPRLVHEAAQRFEFEGTEHLDQAFAKGNGIIFVISHLGSWELLAFLPYLRKYPCSVVGRPMKNPLVYNWVMGLRNSTTLKHIDKKNAAKVILSDLRKNRLVAILIDQWSGPEGIWVDFFGKATSTTSIPARLARKTGAALIPAHCLRVSNQGYYKIKIYPEVAIQGTEADWEEKTTLELNRLLEQQIKLYPEQWSWGHRRWKGVL